MKVLLLDNWCDEAKSILPYNCDKHHVNNTDYIGLITNLENYTSEYFTTLPNLKFVASCTTGLDHLPVDYLRFRGIDIIHLDNREFLDGIWATAEHTWALILSLIRKVPFAHADVCAGNWEREAWQGTELHSKTLGIIGYGRLGRQMSIIATAFGMKVIFDDIKSRDELSGDGAHFVGSERHEIDIDTAIYIQADKCGIDYVLSNSDIITVHVPLNKETFGMFGAEQFYLMKDTAYFINTSRGNVVNEGALWRALKEKQIAGAAIDVCSGDTGGLWWPLQEYAMNNDNLIITPHIAGNTAESRRKTQIYIANRIKEYIGGG